MTGKNTEWQRLMSEASRMNKGDTKETIVPVQNYLEQFGYLRSESFDKGTLDESTSKALTEFQRLRGLEETSELDAPTLEQLAHPRCGMSDSTSALAASAPLKWDLDVLGYAFFRSPTGLNPQAAFDAVSRAFQTWEVEVPIQFVKRSLDQPHEIRIDWVQVPDPDYNTDTRSLVGGVVAHADWPLGSPGQIKASTPKPIHFDNSEESWVVGAALDAYDIESIALHEIGHILGLTHSSDPSDVMFGSVEKNSTAKRDLHQRDISRIRAFYQQTIT